MQQDNDTGTFYNMEPLFNELNNFIQNVDSESIDRKQAIKQVEQKIYLSRKSHHHCGLQCKMSLALINNGNNNKMVHTNGKFTVVVDYGNCC